MADTRSTFASFKEPIKVVEVLIAGDAQGAGRQSQSHRTGIRLSAGRVSKVISGPPLAVDENMLDRSQARLEMAMRYEQDSGRLLEERYGGALEGGEIAYKKVYEYHPDNDAPWADKVRLFERIPGQAELAETESTTFKRDALGRVTEEKRSNGSILRTTFDRTANQPIQVRTGAGAVTKMVYDGAGRQLAVIRPNQRGETRYAYDLDGRLLRQVTSTNSESWQNAIAYDSTGRWTRVDYHDGTHEAISATTSTQPPPHC